MSVEIVHERGTAYAVDWRIVAEILRTWARYTAMLQHGKEITESQVDWYNPFSWMMPDIVSYEVDWRAVRATRDRLTDEAMAAFEQQLDSSVPGAIGFLTTKFIDISVKNEEYLKKKREASSKLMANINDSVSDYEIAVGSSKLVRDVAAETILIGATFISGAGVGAALGFAGGGSVMKGYAKYTDTGSFGSAAIETTVSFVMTWMPVTKRAMGAGTLSRAEEAGFVFLEANVKTAQALLEGDTVSQALTKGSGHLVLAGASPLGARVLKSRPAQRLLARSGVPAEIRIRRGSEATALREELSGEMGKMPVKTAVGERLVGIVADNFAASKRKQARRRLAKPGGNGPTCSGSDALCRRADLLKAAIQPVQSVVDPVCR